MIKYFKFNFTLKYKMKLIMSVCITKNYFPKIQIILIYIKCRLLFPFPGVYQRLLKGNTAAFDTG